MKRYYRIIYLIVLIYCVYQFVQELIFILNYSTNHGFREGVLGHPVTITWAFLVLLYWSFWIFGIISILRLKSIGWILLMSVSLMGITYLSIVVANERGEEMYVALLQLSILVIMTILINHKVTFDELRITSKGRYYIGALGLFVLFGGLFLIADQHYIP